MESAEASPVARTDGLAEEMEAGDAGGRHWVDVNGCVGEVCFTYCSFAWCFFNMPSLRNLCARNGSNGYW